MGRAIILVLNGYQVQANEPKNFGKTTESIVCVS